MKKFTKFYFSLLALLLAGGAFANHLSGSLLFSARFSGANEVPAVDTDATGVGGFFINAAKDSLCITISVNGLSGPITGAHIHTGMAGENGPVLVDFTSAVTGNYIQAIVTGAGLTPELILAMLEGSLYFNIHTEINPGGEIRSQITLETDMAFHAMLDGMQEVPMVDTDATGLAAFNLSKTGMKVTYFVVVEGLTGDIVGAHLHTGMMGENGPVVVDLTASVNDNVISGSFDPTEFAGLLDDMNAGNVYINVHTAEFPNGEIRGQLMYDMRISHDAMANTAQEMPEPMGADGNGLALVSLNYTMDTLFYEVQAEGMTGAITGAHFHDGASGVNGGVLISLTDDIMGNRISGFVAGAALTVENINKFLSGGIYINLHTAANPAGEIRGQVYKLAREGYTLKLEGEQEVPEVMTNGSGSGIVSIDRDQTNAHFMMAFNDLTGPFTVSHFHNAAEGVNGDVIFDLGPFFTGINDYDAAFGYWTSEDVNAFDAAAAMAFRNEMVYVNVHSAEFPGGELRGQVNRGLICSDGLVGVFETFQRGILEVYPNPTNGPLTVDVSSLPAGNSTLTILDITGKKVFERIVNPDAQSVVRFDTANLSQGIYILTIAGNEVNYTARVVKQ